MWRKPRDIVANIQGNCACALQLRTNPGEKLFNDLQASRQQRMNVVALRNPCPWPHLIQQRITLNDGYMRKVLREHARRQQPRHTAAHYNRVVGVVQLELACLYAIPEFHSYSPASTSADANRYS